MSEDWKLEKQDALSRAKRVVVKIGSAVLTGQNGLDLRVVNRLADQMSALHDQGLEMVLVSSGAVAAGCKVMSSCQVQGTLAHKQATSAIGQSRLMHGYDQAFGLYDKVTAQILLTRSDLRDRKRFLNARNTLNALLDWGVIPVINENDTVAVQELKFGDNDALAALVLNLIDADLFINLTSAQGVFDDNPLLNPQANILPCIENISEFDLDKICRGKSTQGSGGMYSKLLAARRAAQKGVPTLIVSGHTKFALEKVFAGQELGTWVRPEGKVIGSRKFWLAYNKDSAGDILIDKGAQKALLENCKSLLPVGIIDVRGKFADGDLVRIISEQGQELGVGLCNYNDKDLKKLSGKKSEQIKELMGISSHLEAVHRDNMLLDAAL